jgi:hypothetical protein
MIIQDGALPGQQRQRRHKVISRHFLFEVLLLEEEKTRATGK